MKEWLVLDNGGYRVVVQDANLPIARDWINIPEGADKATVCGKSIAFWKHGAVFFIDSDVEWDFDYGMDCSEYMRLLDDCGAKVIWQRPAYPEDLPFMDSINDQYAEIEQVRQQTIEQTLAERQAQYGSFEDVAFVTENIMSILAQTRVNGLNDLPHTHRMALYMIASKMARIVNGDFNSIDGWHDIAGYAKLVEDTI